MKPKLHSSVKIGIGNLCVKVHRLTFVIHDIKLSSPIVNNKNKKRKSRRKNKKKTIRMKGKK